MQNDIRKYILIIDSDLFFSYNKVPLCNGVQCNLEFNFRRSTPTVPILHMACKCNVDKNAF